MEEEQAAECPAREPGGRFVGLSSRARSALLHGEPRRIAHDLGLPAVVRARLAPARRMSSTLLLGGLS